METTYLVDCKHSTSIGNNPWLIISSIGGLWTDESIFRALVTAASLTETLRLLALAAISGKLIGSLGTSLDVEIVSLHKSFVLTQH